MPSDAPLRLDRDDLYSPQVDQFLEERDALRRAVPEAVPQPWIVRLLYSACFYLSVAGGVGALLAWAALEPFFVESGLPAPGQEEKFEVVNVLFFPTVAAGIGLLLGAVEGLVSRNPQRALVSGLVGLGVGFAGGLVAIFAAGLVFVLMTALAMSFQKNPQADRPEGFALLVFMMGRAAAWAVAAIPAGIGQGIALREKKVVVNGLLGGVLGGLLGGLLFDPIDLLFTGMGDRATLSRAVGLTTIGVLVGLFVGLVEQWTKTAWLLMRAGPLAGKQFILYRNPTVLGSSPKADIYLFKDAAIEPRHALIHNHGGRFTIEDCTTPDGTYVNGIPVRKHTLQPGDQIVLGKTVLEFAVREAT
jgi:hypothetical protein